jgi:hypothetical protein
MALTMRPTGLGSGAYQDNVDYNVFSGEWLIGRMPGRRGRSWKRSPEPKLGPPCAAMICRPPVVRDEGLSQEAIPAFLMVSSSAIRI